MVGKAKSKEKPGADPQILKVGKMQYTVNMKIEAKDSTGNWFDAKILKIKPAEKELLVHFDRWNSRYDVWLPHNSPRIRLPVSQTKAKSREKEWRIGDRVIAKWGPANRIYPATISKILSELSVEVTFYDGFKKVIVKNSLKLDTEKLYRQYASVPRKAIVSTPTDKSNEQEGKKRASLGAAATVTRTNEKRRLSEPVSMADYITNSRKRRKNKIGKNTVTKTETSVTDKTVSQMPINDQPAIPKVKLKLGEHTIAICTDGETITRTYTNSPNQHPTEKLIEHCGIEIEKKKNKSYLLFPSVDAAENAFSTKPPSTGPQNSEVVTKVPEATFKKSETAPKIPESIPKKTETRLKNLEGGSKTTTENKLKSSVSNSKLKVKFSFGVSPKTKTDISQVDIDHHLSNETSNSPEVGTEKDSKSQINKPSTGNHLVEEKCCVQRKESTKENSSEIKVNAQKTFKDEIESQTALATMEKESTKEESLSAEKQTDGKQNITHTVEHLESKSSEKQILSRRISERMELKRKEKESSKNNDGEETKMRGQQRGKASVNSEKPSSTEMFLQTSKKEKTTESSRERNQSSLKEQTDSSHERKRTLSSSKEPAESSRERKRTVSSAKEPTDSPHERKRTLSSSKEPAESSRERKRTVSSAKEPTDSPHERKRTLSSSKEPAESSRDQKRTLSSAKGKAEFSREGKRTLSSKEDQVKSKTLDNEKQKALYKKNCPVLSNRKTAKPDAKNFEQKYEMFKQKWKAEKERRRKLKAIEPDINLSSYISTDKRNKDSAQIDKDTDEKFGKTKPAKIDNEISAKNRLKIPVEYSQVASKPKVKHTPSTRFGRRQPIQTNPLSVNDSETGKGEISLNEVPQSEVQELHCPSVTAEVIETTTTHSTVSPPITTTTLAASTSTSTATIHSSSTLSSDVAPVKKKGWPKGKPRKRKVDVDQTADTSRTPNILETISFASMVEEERPSQKSRPVSVNEIPSKKLMREPPIKTKENHYYSSVFRPDPSTTLPLGKVTPSLTQIVASRIQKRVHHHKSQSVNMFNSSPIKKGCEDVAAREPIPLHYAGAPKPMEKVEQHQKKNLNFITGRLQYKMKIDALKLRNAATLAQNLEISHYRNSAQRGTSDATPMGSSRGMASAYTPTHMLQSPPHAISNSHLLFTAVPPPTNIPFTSFLHPEMSSMIACPNSTHAFGQIPNVKYQICSMKPTCICLNCHEKRISVIRSPPIAPFNNPMTTMPNMCAPPPPPVVTSIASSINEKLRQKIVGRTTHHLQKQHPQSNQTSGLELLLKSPLTSSVGQPVSTDGKDEPKKKRKSIDNAMLEKAKQRKGYKDLDLQRPKSESEKEAKNASKHELDEFKCTLPGCHKTFRKSYLLEYHLRYYHTAKPVIKRSRSSISVSSVDSNPTQHPQSLFTSDANPQRPEEKRNAIGTKEVESVEIGSKDVDVVVEMSEEESESEEEWQSVDDCVKCVCEDECELGFMIQCEQCFTWQHGECVGYSTQKAVPLFYLCHICSKPKGLRQSCLYNNDYTWYRYGRLPPLDHSSTDPGRSNEGSKLSETKRKEIIEATRHVSKDDEDVLASIMLASHAMVTDLFNIRDVIQNARNKLTILSSSVEQPREEANADVNDISDEQLEQLLNEINTQYQHSRYDSTNKYNTSETITNREGVTNQNTEIELNENRETAANENIEKEGNKSREILPNKNDTIVANEHSEKETKENREIIPSKNDATVTNENIENEKNKKCEKIPNENRVIVASQNNEMKVSNENIDLNSTNEKQTTNLSPTKSRVKEQKTLNEDDTNEVIVRENDHNTNSRTKNIKQEELYQENTLVSFSQRAANFDIKAITCHGIEKIPKSMSYENITKKEFVARYQLLFEIEKVEDQVEQRLKEMTKVLDDLENEYVSIDRSKEILKAFEKKFQLPDMRSFQKFLNRIKWTHTLSNK